VSSSFSARSFFAMLSLGLAKLLLATLSCMPEAAAILASCVYILDTITLRIPSAQICREAQSDDGVCVSRPKDL
jgi:hypothetical protein